jgi:hypothetical protein
MAGRPSVEPEASKKIPLLSPQQNILSELERAQLAKLKVLTFFEFSTGTFLGFDLFS